MKERMGVVGRFYGPDLLSSVLIGLLSVPVTIRAQVAHLQLKPPDAILNSSLANDGGFSMVTSVRELEDGRVLVADWRENRLVAVDMQSEETLEIGRAGEGPGEYSRVGRIYAMGADSSLVTDAFSRRWLILDGTEVVRTIPASAALPQWLGPLLSGVDTSGRVLGVREHPHPPVVSRADADTLVLLLGRLDDSRIDTLARLRGPGSFSRVRVRADGRMVSMNHPLRTEDQAQIFPDGWIAVAWTDPYRVDWRSPEGRWTRGEPLAVAPVAVGRAEQCFAIRRMLNGTATCDLVDEVDWPETLPVYLLYDIGAHTARGTSTLFAGPQGRLLIRRAESAALPGTRYDVIDRGSHLVGVIALPENEAIVGFGSSSVYTVVTDELDLQTLRRHPWR